MKAKQSWKNQKQIEKQIDCKKKKMLQNVIHGLLKPSLPPALYNVVANVLNCGAIIILFILYNVLAFPNIVLYNFILSHVFYMVYQTYPKNLMKYIRWKLQRIICKTIRKYVLKQKRANH